MIRKILALDKGMSKYFTRDSIISDFDLSVWYSKNLINYIFLYIYIY